MTISMLCAGALLVRLGIGLYTIGLARSKNSSSAAMRTICDICAAALAFWAIGGALVMGEGNGVLSIAPTYLLGVQGDLAGDFAGYLVLGLIGSGLFAGAVAERSMFRVVFVMSIVTAGLIVPVAGHWVWNGWLKDLGFVDVAGASVLHVTAGACALMGSIIVGPRMGKYNRDGSSNAIPAHNVPWTTAGALCMVMGWGPYVLLAAYLQTAVTAHTLLNVLLAGAAGGLSAILAGRIRYGKAELYLAFTGLLGGLVAITASGGNVPSICAVILGAVAGIVVPAISVLIDLRWKIDDPGSVIAIHGAGGIWALIGAGIFEPIPVAEHARLLGVQLLGIVTIAALAGVVSLGVLAILKTTVGVRAKEADEFDGLDLAEHDINAYPDFQQTTIKSYHLREA